MPRVKRSVAARKKRRKVLHEARGYWGLKHSSYKAAKEQVEHSLVYAYRDRKNRKRTMRSLWIIRINAAARQNGLSYNQFMAGLRLLGGVHTLVLTGRASWDRVGDALVDERDFLRGFVSEQRVQTNEVQRCWALLPCFLEAARRLDASTVDLIELGTSAGLLLL